MLFILKTAFTLSIALCVMDSIYIQKEAEKINILGLSVLEPGIMTLKAIGKLTLDFFKEASLAIQVPQFTNTTSRPGVVQWIKCQPANQRVMGSIPSQGTVLGCGPGPQ